MPYSNEQKVCMKCQECCRWLTFILSAETAITLQEFYEVRGCKIKDVPGNPKAKAVMVPTICPNITPWGCDIYQRRPRACRDYDGRDDPFIGEKCQLPKGEIE